MVLLSEMQVVALHGSDDRQSVSEVLRRVESVVTGMAKEYIDKEAFIRQYRELHCKDCDRRKGMKNGKMRFVYGIGEAPCRACWIEDMIDCVDDWPAADVRENVIRTQGDRLRAMDDEELAVWHEQCCPNRDDIDKECQKESCEMCWLDWLKQEVEE